MSVAWRLARIEGQGIRILEAPWSVDLPERGIVHVAGTSGVGKSTLLAAIGFALGYGPPATRLQNWNDVPLKVAVTLRAGEREIVVARAAKLRVTIDGRPVEGNARAQEDALRKELGPVLDLADQLAWRRQRSRSAFLGMPDAERKAFLAGARGIEAHEQRIKDGVKRLAAAEISVSNAAAAAQSWVGALDALGAPPDLRPLKQACVDAVQVEQDAHERLTQVSKRRQTIFTAHDEEWSQRKANARLAVEDARRSRQRWKDKIVPEPVAEQEAMLEAERVQADCAAMIRERAGTLQEARRTWEAARSAMARADETSAYAALDLRSLEGRMSDLDHEIEHIRGATCPTCHQHLPENTSKEVLEKATLRMDAFNADRERIKKKIGLDTGCLKRWVEANPAPVDPDLDDLLEAQRVLRDRVVEARMVLGNTTILLGRDRAEHLALAQEHLIATEAAAASIEREFTPPLLVEADRDILRAQAQFSAAQAEKGAVYAALGVAEVAHQKRKAIADYLQTAEAQLADLRRARDLEADTLEAVRAFVGRWFDEMLISVADRINVMLANIPNVRHCSLSFRSEVTNQKGEVTRNAIIPVLSVDGHEIVGGDLDGASGGMLSSVELAVDLAVLREQEEALGRAVGWLVIDEAFEGLPANSREACFEILRTEAVDRLVLVVDHMSEVGGLADHRIEMASTNGRATVGPCRST